MDKNRKTAYEVLLDMEQNHSYSNLALNNFIGKRKPDNPAFVRELVYGVLREKILLDYILEQLIPTGLRKVKKQDAILLRMGLYQLEFMDSVPEYAAVNEMVKLAKSVSRGKEGFINGVLRGFLKKQDDIVLPAEDIDLVRYLSVKYSYAEWMIILWLVAYGRIETERILEASNETPALCLRANLLKTTQQELIGLLEQEGFYGETGTYSERSVLIRGKGTGILETKLYEDGYFSVQDEASILAADTLHPQPGNIVIDVCAAPGGKTLAMAEKMAQEGKIYALDVYPHKLELIHAQAKRLGVESVIETRCHNGTEAEPSLKGLADCVLVDAPCSGLGVIRRKPEIKYKEKEDMSELIVRQQKILQASASYVKIGGALVYSTCTINPDENENQINLFLKQNSDFELAEMNQLMPTEESDGFFISKMIRI